MASNTVFTATARRLLPTGRTIPLWNSSKRSLSNTTVLGCAAREPMHPNYNIDTIQPPKYWSKPADEEEDPGTYTRKPVSSAHTIDLSVNPPKLSAKDSAALSPSGSVIHGRYGELSIEASHGIPLEYLALLHPAAEGAAAYRTLKGSDKGTLLIYGASEPSAMATLQLASSDGVAVVGVVAGHHSGKTDFVDVIKSFTVEPGTVVPEEFALVKSAFREVVEGAVKGDSADDMAEYDPDTFLADFQKNLLEYADYFPETQLSPNPEDYTFAGKEKDRENFDVNITAYLSQFQKGAPKFDEVVLKESLTKEQYAIYKSKFHQQTTAVISDDDDAVKDFNPAGVVKQMIETPESVSQLPDTSASDYIPYEFSPLKNQVQNGVDVDVGGPILGAVVAVTPELSVAFAAVAKGKTLRDKAEALQFLTESEKNAFAAANSVFALAKEAGKPVVVVGGKLPGMMSIEPTDEDVKEALAAMALGEGSNDARLNYFLQIYRASDYPVYADYAIHRATEELSGPRQIIVTK